MATAVNTIANGGATISPSLIEGQATTTPATRSAPRPPPRSAWSAPTRPRRTAEMMELVTTPDAAPRPGPASRATGSPARPAPPRRSAAPATATDGGQAVSFAGLRAGRQPALHRLRRGQAPAGGRQRRWHRRPGVPQGPDLRAAEVRRPADRHHAAARSRSTGSRVAASRLDSLGPVPRRRIRCGRPHPSGRPGAHSAGAGGRRGPVPTLAAGDRRRGRGHRALAELPAGPPG